MYTNATLYNYGDSIDCRIKLLYSFKLVTVMAGLSSSTSVIFFLFVYITN